MSDDKNSVRCKACNVLFSPVWHKDRGEWEELCYDCLSIALRGINSEDDYMSEIPDILDIETNEFYNE